MKITWDNEMEDIGVYECELITDSGERHHIGIKDYTCPFEQQQAAKDPVRFARYHPYAYEVSYACGYSMHQGFDKTYTLEQIKIWAEDYLLNKLIGAYQDTLERLETMKINAEQAQAFKDARKKEA